MAKYYQDVLEKAVKSLSDVGNSLGRVIFSCRSLRLVKKELYKIPGFKFVEQSHDDGVYWALFRNRQTADVFRNYKLNGLTIID